MEYSCLESMEVSSAPLAVERQSANMLMFLHPVDVALLMARRIAKSSASVNVALPAWA